MKQLYLALLLTATTLSASAAERVLLPLPVGRTTPGGYGSIWKGELTVYNGGTTTATVRTSNSLCNLATCPVGVFKVPPGGTRDIVSGTSILSVEPAIASLAFNGRIFDESRSFHDWGTEFPVVSERSFRSRVILLNVPTSDDFRAMLRIFDSVGGTYTPVTIRYVDPLSGQILKQEETILEPLEPNFLTEFEFGRAEVPLDLPTGGEGLQRYHLDISTVDPGARLWGFVSITHNETQRVTLVTPQPSCAD